MADRESLERALSRRLDCPVELYHSQEDPELVAIAWPSTNREVRASASWDKRYLNDAGRLIALTDQLEYSLRKAWLDQHGEQPIEERPHG